MREVPTRHNRLAGFVRVLIAILTSGFFTSQGDALAQSSAEEAAQLISQNAGTPDFLFGRPRGWAAVRGVLLVPRAGGDLFEFVRDQLTVEQNDFRSPGIAGEIGFSITSRLQAAGGVEFGRQTVQSEYRRFIDNAGLPINQETTLSQTHFSGGIRVLLRDQGRSVSRLAYVPRAVIPYVGAGGGLISYEFVQRGDFVDFVTLRVFTDTFQSAGWEPSAHVFGGTDLRVWRALLLGFEARYIWAHGDLQSDFIGFDGIDLDGFRFSSGIGVMF